MSEFYCNKCEAILLSKEIEHSIFGSRHKGCGGKVKCDDIDEQDTPDEAGMSDEERNESDDE